MRKCSESTSCADLPSMSPFWTDESFDFWESHISGRMSEHTAVFLKQRLSPPPEEVYTLHRKPAGAYMLCIKLAIVANHLFDDGMEYPVTGCQ
jgi:hypothetical protein